MSAKTGKDRIVAERLRQLTNEGWSYQHDDKHARGELVAAARSYSWHATTLIETGRVCKTPPPTWPWSLNWWKPSSNPVRDWEKSGALYLAEAERLHRLKQFTLASEHIEVARQLAYSIDRFLARAKA